MNRRDAILSAIWYEGAKYGKITKEATRLYIENRIGYKTFREIINKGIEHYNAKLDAKK